MKVTPALGGLSWKGVQYGSALEAGAIHRQAVGWLAGESANASTRLQPTCRRCPTHGVTWPAGAADALRR
jgi:hypothetical protein